MIAAQYEERIEKGIDKIGDALHRRFGTWGVVLFALIFFSPWIILGYGLLSPTTFLKVVLISAASGIVVVSLTGRVGPSDWRQMRFADYVLLAIQIVFFGFFGLLAAGYVLFYIGLWPSYVLGD
jgi:hypothetical protein